MLSKGEREVGIPTKSLYNLLKDLDLSRLLLLRWMEEFIAQLMLSRDGTPTDVNHVNDDTPLRHESFKPEYITISRQK